MKFRERYLTGKADFEEIFDLTDQWNFSDEACTLREFLGLTAEEEDVWISESDEALQELMEKEKNRKIFFTDLDGTLLNDAKELSDGNRAALQELLEKGHVISISTGRALPSAIKQAKRLGLMKKNCYIICFNGGQIYDVSRKELIYQQSLSRELVRGLFDEASSFGINVQTYTDTHVITEKDNESLHKYVEIQGLPYKITDDVIAELDHEPAKVLALDYASPEHVTAFREYITQRYGDKVDIYLSHPCLLELVPPGVNKGNAVHFLCSYLGIPLENSVSAGDAENDLTMLEASHVGAAMCNGEPLLKEKADYITQKDNNHDGVAEILRKFILN